MVIGRLLSAFLIAAGLILLPETSSAQKRGGTLVMLVQPEPPTLAAYVSTSGPIGQVMSKVYEGLLEYDFNLKPLPGLRSHGSSRRMGRPSRSSSSRA